MERKQHFFPTSLTRRNKSNVDANIFTGKAGVWTDLRNPLPFKDNSVDLFYPYHMLEHIQDVAGHFRELHRCLKPGGSLRIGCPSGDGSIRKFLENDLSWFSDFPEKRKSIGGRFENYLTCKGEHLTIITFSFLEEVATDAGFVKFQSSTARQGNFSSRACGQANPFHGV